MENGGAGRSRRAALEKAGVPLPTLSSPLTFPKADINFLAQTLRRDLIRNAQIDPSRVEGLTTKYANCEKFRRGKDASRRRATQKRGHRPPI